MILYRNLVRADHFDKCFLRRIMTGSLVGFYHPGQGQFASHVGGCSFLGKDDILMPTHRGHGLAHMISKGIDPRGYLAEHCGKASGCCKGRSSYHFSYPDDGVFSMSGFIGHQFAPSVGWGLACKMNGRGQIAMVYCGDGATGQGAMHEAFLMTNNWKLPVVYVVENNGLAIFTDISSSHPTKDIADLANGYGMPAVIVDGQDVIACAEAALVAIEHARSGKGPYLIEAKTARFMSHAVGIPDLVDYTPRTHEQIAELAKRDPIVICRERLLAEGVLTQELIDQIEASAMKEVADAEKFTDESPVPELDMKDVSRLVYAD
jgi:pyruvate dehydrogenase E1 component alpha subunit